MDATARSLLAVALDRVVDEALRRLQRGEAPYVQRPYMQPPVKQSDPHVVAGPTTRANFEADTRLLTRRCADQAVLPVSTMAPAVRTLATIAGEAWLDELNEQRPEHYYGTSALQAFLGVAADVVAACADGTPREAATEAAVERFERFSAMRTVSWQLRVALKGASVAYGPHDLSHNLVLRAADDDFKMALWAAHGPGAGYGMSLGEEDSMAVWSLDSVLEQTVATDLDGWPSLHEAESEFAAAVTALRVHGARRLQRFVSWTLGPPEIDGFIRMPPSSIGRLRPDTSSIPTSDPLEVVEHLAQEVRSWIEQFHHGHSDDALDFAIQRFNLCDERARDDDRIVDAWIALESLLSRKSETEIGYRVALRLAILLGRSADERKAVRKSAKVSYDLRSEIVHGTPPAKRSTKQPVEEITLATEGLLRDTLRRWVRSSFGSPEELIPKLEERILTGGSPSESRSRVE
jgi:hypothetical protein